MLSHLRFSSSTGRNMSDNNKALKDAGLKVHITSFKNT